MRHTRRSSWILVVDDNGSVRAALASAFRAREWGVLQAENGFDALSLLELSPVSAVLTDIQMPRMDGVLLARALRGQAAFADLPLFAHTAELSLPDEDRALFTSVFTKPMEFGAMFAAIAAVVSHT